MAKIGHLCFMFDTPTPRRKCACLGVELPPRRTRDPFREVSSMPRHNTAIPRRTSTPRRSTVLRLGQATFLVLFFLRLILESVTFLFGLAMGDN